MKTKPNGSNAEFLPNFTEPEPPLRQLIDFVDHEIQYRRKSYPRRIERGNITANFAWKQINLMEAVKRKLESLRSTS